MSSHVFPSGAEHLKRDLSSNSFLLKKLFRANDYRYSWKKMIIVYEMKSVELSNFVFKAGSSGPHPMHFFLNRLLQHHRQEACVSLSRL